jgi:UDP-glucose 4,6-dehydratase
VDLILHKGLVGETYNIGTTFEISNRELASRLVSEMGLPGNTSNYLEFVPDRAFNDRRYAIDSKKLKTLGWSPKVSFEEGIRKTIDWYKANAEYVWDNVVNVLVPYPKLRIMPSSENLSTHT